MEEDIYSMHHLTNFLEDDEISAGEEGFMMGYLEDLGVA